MKWHKTINTVVLKFAFSVKREKSPQVCFNFETVWNRNYAGSMSVSKNNFASGIKKLNYQQGSRSRRGIIRTFCEVRVGDELTTILAYNFDLLSCGLSVGAIAQMLIRLWFTE